MISKPLLQLWELEKKEFAMMIITMFWLNTVNLKKQKPEMMMNERQITAVQMCSQSDCLVFHGGTKIKFKQYLKILFYQDY